jgi:Glycosyltransferase family 87
MVQAMSIDRGDSRWGRRQRWLEQFVLALLFGTMLIRVALIWNNWGFEDVNAYWLAAHRLREGQPLYLGSLDPDSYRVFRYAPWFAWLWVPLSYLPKELVTAAWGILLGGASVAILAGVALVRRPAAWALAFILTPWLLSLVQVGNVQPLMVATLAFGVSRRTGPLWIAVAASLKGAPLIWTLTYLARREWGRIVMSVLITAALVAPMLLTDLSGYTTDPGRSYSLYYYVSPLAWAVAAIASTVVAIVLAWRRSRYVWVATAVAAMLIPPKTYVTYATFLAVAVLGDIRDSRSVAEPA